MGIIRNFIDIMGISSENELPDTINGQLIKYSDIETLYIPDDKPAAKSIFQIILQAELTSTRMINTPLDRIMTIDGVKKFKMIYTEDQSSNKANCLELCIPYNSYVELPKWNRDVEKIDIFILDAYFDLIDRRKIYSYILYLLHVHYSNIEKAAENDADAQDRLEESFFLITDDQNELKVPHPKLDEESLPEEASELA